MKSLSISITPSGAFCLHITAPSPHNIIIPVSEQGAQLLARTIRDWTDTTLIATPGNPIQAQIDEELKGESWGDPKQLAGKHRRFAEIRAATGIAVKVCKPFATTKKKKTTGTTPEQLRALMEELGL